GAGVLRRRVPDACPLCSPEPVQPIAGGIAVRARSGRRVEQGPAAIDGARLSVPIHADEPGTYLVTWQVIAEDTHPARGRFAFSVGEESDPPATETSADVGGVSPVGLGLQIGARWLHFGGFALRFGLAGF